jgi:beta-lactamase superfamily II metal-dependent hydrolase
MMDLTALRAFTGDGFILEWGGTDEKFSMIIDAGFPATYNNELVKILPCLSNLCAVIVTHVDYDHLGGIIKLLHDKNVKHDYTLYVNTPDLILDSVTSAKVGFQHGDILIKLLEENNIATESIFLPDVREIVIEGLTIKILSPTLEIIEQLKKDWDAFSLHAKEKILDKVSTKRTKNFETINKILDNKESMHAWEDDIANSSSIAFIASFQDENILLLGDSNPSVIENELIGLGYSEECPLDIDLLKISHHGSKHNTTKSLMKILKTKKVLISTNQRGKSRHPDREAIIKIAKCIQRKHEYLEFIFNYPISYSEFITNDEIKELKLDFKVLSKIKINE